MTIKPCYYTDAIQDNHNSQIWAAKSTLRALVPCPKVCLSITHTAKIEAPSTTCLRAGCSQNRSYVHPCCGSVSWLCWPLTGTCWEHQCRDTERTSLNDPTNSFSFPIDLGSLHHFSAARSLHIFLIFENLSLPVPRVLSMNCLIFSIWCLTKEECPTLF